MNEQTTQTLGTITLELTHELLRCNSHRQFIVMTRHIYVGWKGMNVTLGCASWSLRTQASYKNFFLTLSHRYIRWL